MFEGLKWRRAVKKKQYLGYEVQFKVIRNPAFEPPSCPKGETNLLAKGIITNFTSHNWVWIVPDKKYSNGLGEAGIVITPKQCHRIHRKLLVMKTLKQVPILELLTHEHEEVRYLGKQLLEATNDS